MSAPLPEPHGRYRHRWRRVIGEALGGFYAGLEKTPPGRMLRRRLRAGLEFTATDVPIDPGKEGLDSLEIVFLSDLHAGLFMTEEDLLSIFERASVLEPDLLFLGGDLVNTHVEQLALFERALEKIEPPLGIYGVPGNHDYFHPERMESWIERVEGMGVRVLRNTGARIERDRGSFWIAGVDDMTESVVDLDAALSGRRPGEPTLLLSHHPDLFVEAAEREVDLQLSGHTHGGQIRLFGWAPMTHSAHGLVAGLYRRGDAHLYVGRGVGVTTVPLRVGVRSEVALLRLRVTP